MDGKERKEEVMYYRIFVAIKMLLLLSIFAALDFRMIEFYISSTLHISCSLDSGMQCYRAALIQFTPTSID